MPSVPAICDSCGAVFDPGAINLGEGVRNVMMSGNKAGPCPRCGGMGSIPDGVYDSLGGVLNIALSEGYTPEQLNRIIGLLSDAAGRTGAEIADDVAKESPALGAALRKLLVPKTPADLTGYLALILTVLSLLRTLSPAPQATMTPAEVEQLVSTAVAQAIEQTQQAKKPQPRASTQTQSHRPGAAGRKPKKPRRRGGRGRN